MSVSCDIEALKVLYPKSSFVVILLTHEITLKITITTKILLFKLLLNRFTIYYLLWLVNLLWLVICSFDAVLVQFRCSFDAVLMQF